MKRPADSAFDEQIALPSPPADSPISELDPPVAGPSRKRARSELTAEERKEARAHRNRIAAQNSRDRRKAQFQYLEQRVAQLEEENKQLRAGLGLAELSRSDEQTSEQREREKAREKENEELRARIKTLENGWDAVVKALTASGLPLNLPGPPPSSSESSSNHPSNPPPSAYPVIVPPTPVFPISPSPTASPSSSLSVDFDEFESTRHLARVATTDAPPLSSVTLQRVDPATRINFNSSSLLHLLLQQRRQRLHPLMRLPMSTRLPWKTSSGRSSRQVPPCRRRLCLLIPSPKRNQKPNPQPQPPWSRR
ncbi:hypothetical protein ABKN59_005709 [Abortiporus biennis]